MIELDNLTKEDLCLAIDVKRALAAEHDLCPDVEAELSRFHLAHPEMEGDTAESSPFSSEPSSVSFEKENCSCEEGRRRRKPLFVALAVSALAAAAILVFVFVLGRGVSDNDYAHIYTASAENALSVTTDGKPAAASVSSPITIKGHDITVTETAQAGSNTIKTPSGEFYTVTLADGTVVKLNVQSELTFPSQFAADHREVYLKGEAYFDVHHDPAHPFIVKTDFFEAKAVGTAFNVRAYSAEQANVTLIEGRLIVSSDTQKPMEIKPNEQTALQPNGTLAVAATDTYQYTEWASGMFYFDDIALGEILRELGRWYNVDIDVADQQLLKTKLHFVADRTASIDEALRNLNALGLFQATVSDRKVVVEDR